MENERTSSEVAVEQEKEEFPRRIVLEGSNKYALLNSLLVHVTKLQGSKDFPRYRLVLERVDPPVAEEM